MTFYCFSIIIFKTVPEKRSERKSTRTFTSGGMIFFRAVEVSARQLDRRRRTDSLVMMATNMESKVG